MRVTENRMMEIAASGSTRAREQVAEAGRKLTTGLDVERPSHDPVRWSNGMRLKSRLTMAGEHRGTVERAVDKLNATDAAFGRINDALTRARELATAMANGTVDAATRATAALEAVGLFGEVRSAANAQGLDGEYLLAGNAGDQAPFDDAGVYGGDAQVRSIEVSEGQRRDISVPGTVLTAAAGVDVFGTIADLQTALEANDTVAVQTSIGQLTLALDQVTLAQGRAGSASASLRLTQDALSAFEVQLSASIEGSVASDPVAAATDLAKFSNQLEASRAVAQRISQLMNPNG